MFVRFRKTKRKVQVSLCERGGRPPVRGRNMSRS
jgi:hypothetical protein